MKANKRLLRTRYRAPQSHDVVQEKMKRLIHILLAIMLAGSAFSQTIVYPEGGTALERLAAQEIRRYIYLRTGKKLPLRAMDILPAVGDVILVADNDHAMIRPLQNAIGHPTSPGGFILKTVANDGRRVLVITGHDSAATLHGAYRFAEHLGVGFDLAGDAIPDAKITLDITGFDEVGVPRFRTRGILPFHDFFAGPDLWNTEDYKAIIAQLPKLGMNFIGFHTYNTRYASQWARENDVRTGPEPTVWIGLPQDVNPDGTVSWSYAAHYAHTHRRKAWGLATWDTDHFHAGANLLFPTSGYGSDILGKALPADGDLLACNAVFNRAGALFNAAFSLARRLGVKTALGTELPLGLEPAGKGDIDPPEDWVRGMPVALQERLARLRKDPADPNVVKEIYKGIFTRIMRSHPLDYYWLWSYEIWSDGPGVTEKQIRAIKNDIALAQQALAELGNPFQIAHAGWRTGSVDNPGELEDVFPPEAPFYSQWGDAEGHDQLSAERIKWPGISLEQDWGLVQPQGGVYSAHEDISKAVEYECDGSIGNIWRTRILSPNIHGVKNLHWAYGPTGQTVARDLPADMWQWAEYIYRDWASRQFGPDASPLIATILSELDGEYPAPTGWEEDGPGEILRNAAPWARVQKQYDFVAELESLRSRIAGAGNLERFDYWLKTMQSLRLMGQYGCVRHDFERAMRRGDYTRALRHRIEMARLFERMVTLHVEKATNASDLGEIIHLELVNWKQLMMNRWDAKLAAGLGKPIPAEANPSQVYRGAPLIKVTPARSHVEAGESLVLRVLALGCTVPITLRYRVLGEEDYTAIPLTRVSRAVYQVAIPPQNHDFEYYIEARTPVGTARFPTTAPKMNQSVVVIHASETTRDHADEPRAVHKSETATAKQSDRAKPATAFIVPEWPSTPPDNEWVSYHLAHPGPHYANPGDPNGAIFFNGRYHLHYLLDIETDSEGLAWAHVSSADMVHWTWHPTVLIPSRQKHGMFSGSAFLTKQGQPAIIYHGGNGPDMNFISVALDNNLNQWGKPQVVHPWDPVENEPVNYDTWWDPDCWVMDDHYFALTGWGDPSLMKSQDLRTWVWMGELFHEDYDTKTLGGVSREEDVSCPNMFRIGGKWMLLNLSHRMGCRYYLGDFIDGKYLPTFHGRMNFHNRADDASRMTVHAPESLLTPDGRRVMWAWLQCDGSPSGIQSLPRELSLPADGILRIKPIRELESLRYNEIKKKNLRVTRQADYRFVEQQGNAVEFIVSFEPPLPKAFGVKMLTDPSDDHGITITAGRSRNDVEIRESFGARPNTIRPPFKLRAGEDLTLRVFIDNKVVEIFINDRQAAAAHTHEVVRANPSISLFTTDADVVVRELTAWNITSPFHEPPERSPVKGTGGNQETD
jgi:sucrose-6-phosphate hydrolase SacC (GH32 family)